VGGLHEKEVQGEQKKFMKKYGKTLQLWFDSSGHHVV
jgi:hypothetical protein